MGIETDRKKTWQEQSCLYKLAVLGSAATAIYVVMGLCWVYGIVLPSWERSSAYSYEETRDVWLAICFGCSPFLATGVLIGFGFALWEEYLGQ